MTRSDKRYLIYPSLRTIDIIGGTAPAMNQALDCWAAELARGISKNAEDFNDNTWQCDNTTAVIKASAQWTTLALSLREKNFDPGYPHPKELIAAAVEESERFEGIWTKHWVISESVKLGPEKEAEFRKTEFDVFLKKIRYRDFPQAWAIINTVAWYWENEAAIDSKTDQWWQLSFRLSFERKKSSKSEKAKGKKKSPKVS